MNRFHTRFLAALGFLLFLTPTMEAKSSEFNLHAYFIDSEKMATSIGSQDADLMDRLLQRSDFVEQHGLEQRFTPEDQWKTAVSDLITGRERKNEYINPFVIWMLLEEIAEKAHPPWVGAPFADFSDITAYFEARGDKELAKLTERINYGNTTEPFEGLPSVLRNLLGPSEYPARMSVFAPEDSEKLMKFLSAVENAAKEMEAYRFDENPNLAGKAEAVIRKAATKKWMEHNWSEDDLDGETKEQVVARMVQSELNDPYGYADDLDALYEAAPILEKWFKYSVKNNKAIFFIYESF